MAQGEERLGCEWREAAHCTLSHGGVWATAGRGRLSMRQNSCSLVKVSIGSHNSARLCGSEEGGGRGEEEEKRRRRGREGEKRKERGSREERRRVE